MDVNLKVNACAFSAFLLALYSIYCTGSYLANGVWPDGILFGTMAAGIGAAFGFKFQGYLAEKRKKEEEAE